MRAVKYVVSLLATLVTLQAQAVPMIDLVPSSETPGIGESFVIDVFASGIGAGDPLLAFGFDVEPGPGLSYKGAAVALPFFDDSPAFATTDVAGSTLPAVSGNDILLATLSLTAGTAPGSRDFSVVASQGDLGVSEGLFTATESWVIDETVTVEVVDAAPVPVPSTLLLLALGALGVRIWARNAGNFSGS